MKKLINLLCACLLVFALVGCSSSNGDEAEKGGKVLNVFNWGEYIDTDMISEFENEFDCRVNYSLFMSNEEMYTKLLGGSHYDVLVPSDYMIQKMLEEDMLQPLNKEIIDNLSDLYEGTLNKPYDPNNDYSVPYFWGNVGIVYDKTQIDPKDVESEGWEVLRNPKYKGMLYMYDSERDSFMVALKALGYSMNTSDLDEINEAYEWLLEQKSIMSPAYVTDEAIDGLAYGEKAMGVMYSGDAAYILNENENMAFYAPVEQGTNLWNDAMVIPANADNPELANEFIKFMLEYDQSYANSDAVGYISANAEVIEDMTSEGSTYFGNEAYLPKTDNPNDEVFVNNEEIRPVISELWVKVKNS